MEDLVYGICKMMNKTNYPIEIIGIRPGERIHEALIADEEYQNAQFIKENNYIILNKNNNIQNTFKYKIKSMTSSSSYHNIFRRKFIILKVFFVIFTYFFS
jgi:FlaA1/EpsC-like NDP-sugar epimerase